MSMMLTFLHTCIPTKQPLRTGNQSLLKFNPGIGLRPAVDQAMTLISFPKSDPQTYSMYTEHLKLFLNNYDEINAKPDENFAKCDNGVKVPNEPHRVCKFPLNTFGPCTKENQFGYSSGMPCIFAKMNRIYGWMPDIQQEGIGDPLVECVAQNPGDVENLGEIVYYPSAEMDGKRYGRFSSLYFPYLGQAGYLSPLVAIQFKNPRNHTLVMIKCNLANVNNVDPQAVRFELMVD